MSFLHCPTILMVKKLPLDLTAAETTDLLQYFGARSVSVMSSKGIMKGTAFAEFVNREEADIALQKLHQAPLLGSRLVVQYSDKNFMPVEPPDPMLYTEPLPVEPPAAEPAASKPDATPDPSLHYLYPPPTSHTLNNISHALVAVPQFYIQVLHLMNKMNLPPPFTQSSEKSLFESSKDAPPLPSSSESELESEGGEESEDRAEKEKEIMESKRIATQEFIESQTKGDERKRKRGGSGEGSSKVPRVTDMIDGGTVCGNDDMEMSGDDEPGPATVLPAAAHPGPANLSLTPVPLATVHPSLPDPSVPLPASLPPSTAPVQRPTPPPSTATCISSSTRDAASTAAPIPSGPAPIPSGLASIPSGPAPIPSGSAPIPSGPPPIPVPTVLKFMEQAKPTRVVEYEAYRAKMQSQRLPESELAELSVFKKYSPGEPSAKLYIKNINFKSVTEEQLQELFGPYFRFYEGEGEVKLMTRGQMKGQAFVTFPSVDAARDALEDCHGFVLCDKAMAVMYAKSR